MTKYRSHLPQSSGRLFLTDGGIETTLIFHEGLALPYFAAFDLLKDQAGKDKLRNYYVPYADLAKSNGVGFILESPTWRASADWARELGYSTEALAAANREAIALMQELRDRYDSIESPFVVSGCIGPRGDGYDPGQVMTADEAQAYHGEQIGTFRDAGVDMVTAITATNVDEAIGLTRAAQNAGLPVVISFTVETDGRLPTGQDLGDAITAVDEATGEGPAYYMINCAHPNHFKVRLAEGGDWMDRLRGLRANASKCSHAELDEAESLDEGDPAELGAQHGELRRHFPHINVLGGCCGTDHRHIERIYAHAAAA